WAGLLCIRWIACAALWAPSKSLRRLFEPQPLTNLGWVLAAGLIGFAGNELVAVSRIRVGRLIRSHALVAPGLRLRPVIFPLLWGPPRDTGRALLDGVDPSLVDRAEHSIRSVPGINEVETVRMRWLGQRLSVEATVTSDPAMPVGQFHQLEHQADDLIRSSVPSVAAVRLTR